MGDETPSVTARKNDHTETAYENDIANASMRAKYPAARRPWENRCIPAGVESRRVRAVHIGGLVSLRMMVGGGGWGGDLMMMMTMGVVFEWNAN